ncbi:hypothetical protein QGM71_18360 [Virgibacillus sp. C22-A2]|uniref:Transporter n=1 Tax=Virgibacillus tibetensis TaxID=3042313 RepID=A0ABU6KLU6_9BACI|nr:hypothetical protein [Virgibacillus sp. C22-A2]
MNHYQTSQHDDERQFNFPGYLLGQYFGYGGYPPSQWGPGTGGQFPGFPGGPGTGGQFPGQPGGPGTGGQFPGFPGGPGTGGQFPGFPGQFPGGGQSAGPPSSPPPSFQPTQPQQQILAVDPGAIQRCLYRFTYIWLRRDSFWFYPIFVGRNSIAGFRWLGNRWVYYGVDLERIQSFQCY